ncbi:MAG: peptide deformylase [Collinsella sp.]|nr:peptide deformylase [Collinsella sp.]
MVDGKMKECRRDYTGFEAQMIQHMIDHCLGKLV